MSSDAEPRHTTPAADQLPGADGMHARAMWSAGDYPRIAERLAPVAQLLVQAVDAGPGQWLLDVAAGTGNVARAAARRGAVVTAADLTPRMLELGEAQAAVDGVSLDWVEADATDLPFEDAAFDAVTSCFGVMFAPDPQAAAAELARVLRPGGALALASWCPDEPAGGAAAVLRRLFPPVPGAVDPRRWGDPEVIGARLAGGFADVVSQRRLFTWSFADVTQAADFFLVASSVHAAALARLPGDEQRSFRAEVLRALHADAAADGTVSSSAPWLLTTAVRRE